MRLRTAGGRAARRLQRSSASPRRRGRAKARRPCGRSTGDAPARLKRAILPALSPPARTKRAIFGRIVPTFGAEWSPPGSARQALPPGDAKSAPPRGETSRHWEGGLRPCGICRNTGAGLCAGMRLLPQLLGASPVDLPQGGLALPDFAAVGLRWTFAASSQPSRQPFAASFGELA